MFVFTLKTLKALQDDADLKSRASSLGSLCVWPGDEGEIDEKSVKANYTFIKHVPAAWGLDEDVLQVGRGKWIIMAVADSWKASGCCLKHIYVLCPPCFNGFSRNMYMNKQK